MKNTLQTTPHEKYLLIGDTGGGKTTLFLTVPGKKFAYLFDAAAKSSLKGHDVDYEEFLVPWNEGDPYPSSVRKKSREYSDRPSNYPEPSIYLQWVADVNGKHERGFFDQYDVMLIDSLTKLSFLIMMRTLIHQKKVGSEDGRTDYKKAGNTLIGAICPLTALPLVLVCTVHMKMKKDDTTSKTYNYMTMPGQSRDVLPRDFSNVWVCSNEEKKYNIQTLPDRTNPTIRTSFQGLDKFHDVTIGDFNHPEKFGIGKIMGRS